MDALDMLEDDGIVVPAWQIELGKIELQNIASGNTELMTWKDTLELLKIENTK